MTAGILLPPRGLWLPPRDIVLPDLRPMMSVIGRAMGFMGGEGPKTYATWNPSDKGSGVTLSNGNLTAAYTNYTNSNVRATIGKSSGKWYWEATVDAQNASTALNIGIWPASRSISTYIFSTTGVARFLDANVNATDVLGFRFDADAGTCNIYKNNSLYSACNGSPLSISELWHPVMGDDNGGAAVTITANFGASAFTYSVPSGYNSGLYTQ